MKRKIITEAIGIAVSARLIENTLSDGSQTYDIEITHPDTIETKEPATIYCTSEIEALNVIIAIRANC